MAAAGAVPDSRIHQLTPDVLAGDAIDVLKRLEEYLGGMKLPSQAVHCPVRVENSKQAIAPPGPSARSQNKIALLPFSLTFAAFVPRLVSGPLGQQGGFISLAKRVAKFASQRPELETSYFRCACMVQATTTEV